MDTGWARANWVPAIGASLDRDLSNTPGTSQAATSARVQQQTALGAVASTYRLSRGAVFVTNNVPYIGRLNDGSSKQAPSGFVQFAVAKAVTQDIRGLAT